MEPLYYPEWLIRRILRDTNIIAMVGASSNWNRPSYFAMKYLQSKGYRIIPVNPTISGTKLLGENVYANLKDIPEKIEMVDIFQKSERVPEIVDDAITIGAKIVWMQLTVRHHVAAEKAEKSGLTVIMDRCPKIEFGRFSGELGWNGINTRLITSRRSKEIRTN
ncbi:MAG: CoA-binding protein [Alphaproteobacteria bacterium]|jgi:predicted CoA-binding protein|nr:CoA-binding protein [Alphaproteobacteria bacterium]|tara:strand:+ start:92 stop:583 length:492 start_codon:yes stop_codon:yes gene_type:complete